MHLKSIKKILLGLRHLHLRLRAQFGLTIARVNDQCDDGCNGREGDIYKYFLPGWQAKMIVDELDRW